MDFSLDLNPLSPNYRDLRFVNGDLVLTADVNPAGTNPILQDVLQRLRMFLGEWFLDNTQGVPWWQKIMTKNPKQSDIDAILQNVILGTPGVQLLTNYSSLVDRATRRLTITFVCQTTNGNVNWSGILSPVTGGQT